MRIISGQHKGRKISAPKQLPIRPTTDMAKEALFNIINNQYYLDEISVLDLFSGSGNISYEFASRGVNAITAVEIHAGCTQFITEVWQKN
jgi:16S rRNA (guanine966-N2)-methyltransferase